VGNVRFLVGLVLLACGSSGKPKPVTVPPATNTAQVKRITPKQPEISAVGLPARCDKPRWPCMPPRDWVARLCEDVYPDVALHMFAQHTPWQRFYMLKNAEPLNASGGASLLGDKIRRGEEVIALKRNGVKNGMQTSDIGGYDVLRWNGACVTVHDGEFAVKPLPSIGHAYLNWRQLGLPLRQALEADPTVGAVYEEKRRQCRTAGIGRITADCEDYDKKLVEEVVRYVRDGGKLPKPTKVP
jgi:hypothetical protein